ncbi:probable carbohydrate esterase At4g34215 [Chenopodium quinoa]|uniref:probable carbohydrate esterase At4g34215 n=1 Tax=Chenopodium quinoa TaxID=63459 RepID=UPI000B78C327|nr:probable carbohydrate esterase At4g34215 [Chenopodium quinoa]
MTITKLTIMLFLFNVAPTYAELPQDIFILAGQSNMAGRGGVTNGRWDGFVPPECQPSHNILRLDEQQSWVPAHEPLHVDIDLNKTCGIGPGMAFANAVESLGGSAKFGVLGLVPCAVGGTKIIQWERGTNFYNQLVTRAKAAMIGGGRTRAVLWYQGEADTVKLEDAKAYGGRMENFISDLRSDLGDLSLLIIQVALASGEGTYVKAVREAQLGIKLPNVKTVDAKGLRLKTDHLHLTTMSQVHLGLMLARSFLDISHKPYDSLRINVANNSLM